MKISDILAAQAAEIIKDPVSIVLIVILLLVVAVELFGLPKKW